jgi:hypothetical protein
MLFTVGGETGISFHIDHCFCMTGWCLRFWPSMGGGGGKVGAQ